MEKLVTVVGLTSSGKSTLGIELAKYFNGEIISADSRQVYKNLDWCSGKVDEYEKKQAPHHLLDVVELGKQFTLFDYQNLAYKAIDDVISRGKLPILVGGTGLYSRAIVEGYNLTETKADEKFRVELEKLSKEELIDKCKQLHIELPNEITSRRLIRLIETAGKLKKPNQPKYDVIQIGIRWSREAIYERIKLRLEKRMPNMIEEIKNLISKGVSTEFLMSLGLEAKFVTEYFSGKFDGYETFFEELFKEERHFAKRQQTWFNKEKNLIWIDADENLTRNAIYEIEKFLNKK
ncbi:MAG: tRNA (adenosine(37)-N6)-dimethylallyltransferase MiaA [Clostridia bacterium]|nr:tRNA (adenosine(37)-N6)-dimethylallyltransferase MiaA [Clostridia bacterium]